MSEQARDAQDARQAQIEALAEDILRDLANYEDLEHAKGHTPRPATVKRAAEIKATLMEEA